MSTRGGLPGGILAPALVLLGSAALFVVGWCEPELIDLGPHVRPAGIGVLGAAFSSFWLLVAIGKRQP